MYEICHVSKKRWVIFLHGEPKSKPFELASQARLLCDYWNLPLSVHDHVSQAYHDQMKLLSDAYETDE